MSKPDWKDAPEWANWLACDENGDSYWYEIKPSGLSGEWLSRMGYADIASSGNPQWKESLEARPADD